MIGPHDVCTGALNEKYKKYESEFLEEFNDFMFKGEPLKEKMTFKLLMAELSKYAYLTHLEGRSEKFKPDSTLSKEVNKKLSELKVKFDSATFTELKQMVDGDLNEIIKQYHSYLNHYVRKIVRGETGLDCRKLLKALNVMIAKVDPYGDDQTDLLQEMSKFKKTLMSSVRGWA